MEKGEGKKEGNCMKNGVKGLEIFFLCYNLKKCRPAAAFLHARGEGVDRNAQYISLSKYVQV